MLWKSKIHFLNELCFAAFRSAWSSWFLGCRVWVVPATRTSSPRPNPTETQSCRTTVAWRDRMDRVKPISVHSPQTAFAHITGIMVHPTMLGTNDMGGKDDDWGEHTYLFVVWEQPSMVHTPSQPLAHLQKNHEE